MNDEIKRLLELAAKAAGIEHQGYEEASEFGLPSGLRVGRGIWNPHTDDGDSRRLEVALGMLVEVDLEARSVTVVLPPSQLRVKIVHKQQIADGSDGLAEVRLAVLRAAAAIGEVTP